MGEKNYFKVKTSAVKAMLHVEMLYVEMLYVKAMLHVEMLYVEVVAMYKCRLVHAQPAFTCSKLTIETLEQGV